VERDGWRVFVMTLDFGTAPRIYAYVYRDNNLDACTKEIKIGVATVYAVLAELARSISSNPFGIIMNCYT
jgi:hypothetical protein